ncbi:hypothetical protein M011DRAFT_460517 [Sporormia fimetaria CBS 119925]|uniref:Amidoligase enzyme n=1 Tax=Sporormia fimetaria CBS 119925 TaxID=1340428 RepID=A0A6A6V5P1_9PLEO|nr:hypothetical protein M011DRAFT_460517 [Sporormia fimetaria CBS 119925]
MSSSNSVDIQFGAEIEVLCYPRQRYASWEVFALRLRDSLTNPKLGPQKLRCHISTVVDKTAKRYKEWSIVEEETIAATKDTYAVELVTPVFKFSERDWHQELSTAWSQLKGFGPVAENPHCSTHVHLSPKPSPARPNGTWELSDVQKIAKAVLYFERAVDAVMPARRWLNPYCQSNRHNDAAAALPQKLPGEKLAAYIENINGAGTIVQVVNMINAVGPPPTGGAWTRSKVFRWNFCPLIEGGPSTIEFRQPPGSDNETHTRLWINFAVAFVQMALFCEPPSGWNLRIVADPKLLATMMEQGAKKADMLPGDITYLTTWIRNHKQLPEVQGTTKQLQAAGQAGMTFLKKKAGMNKVDVQQFKNFYLV